MKRQQPLERYQAAIEASILTKDPDQKQAMLLLQSCYTVLLERLDVSQCDASSLEKPASQESLHQLLLEKLNQHQFNNQILVAHGFLKRVRKWLSPKQTFEIPAQQLGCYIYGGVGRGKTLLMDYFYESLPVYVRAKRTHFHRFMREIHSLMHQLEGVQDPLNVIGQAYASVYDVLCLDEFVVIDITDAMLLAGLTQAFFQNNLMIITTSNAAPNGLYKDGLQRARFLPAIKDLERNLIIHHLDAAVDYRLRHLEQNPTYVVLKGEHTPVFEGIFRDLTAEHAPTPGQLLVNGRAISYLGCHTDVIWFDFHIICGSMRSVADYIEIALEFHTVLISNLPQLTAKTEDQARRFVHLVDEFYDTNVKLILGAFVNMDALYVGHKVNFEFDRTRSRLIEMQSEVYRAARHVVQSQRIHFIK